MAEPVTIQAVSIGTTIILAFSGYVATYLNSIRLENRKALLQFTNEQLKYLYGPLFSANYASTQALHALLLSFPRSEAFPSVTDPIPADSTHLARWRLFMKEVAMPLNLKMEQAIIDNMHLIEELEMPPSFKEFLVHVSDHKLLVKGWDEGDFTKHYPTQQYPRTFDHDVTRAYLSIKARQNLLINRKKARHRRSLMIK